MLDHSRERGVESDVPGRTLGAAIDIGSTTVALLLVDLHDLFLWRLHVSNRRSSS